MRTAKFVAMGHFQTHASQQSVVCPPDPQRIELIRNCSDEACEVCDALLRHSRESEVERSTLFPVRRGPYLSSVAFYD